jgi:hypothetical protein
MWSVQGTSIFVERACLLCSLWPLTSQQTAKTSALAAFRCIFVVRFRYF